MAISKFIVFIPTFFNIEEEGVPFIDTPSSLYISPSKNKNSYLYI